MTGASVFWHSRLTGLAVSVAVHAAVFTAGTFAFVKPVEYGVEVGSGGIEVNLVAAPAEAPIIPEPDPVSIFQNELEEEMPEPTPEPVNDSAEKEVLRGKETLVGDGSSPIPGSSETTYQSSAGAVTEARPEYLKNPAPVYPRIARRNGWEGVVVLVAVVGADGRPISIVVERSSGHQILDESARKAVLGWRFSPASIGSLAVESSVRFPVRFELTRRTE
jgi:protein TonB